MEKFRLLMRKALINDYYKEIVISPKEKQNKDYYLLLKSNKMIN